jgi:hypothetical protein
VDSYQVLLESLLHVLHFLILHFLWDDDSGHHSKPKHSCCSCLILLWILEPLLRLFPSTNGKYVWTLSTYLQSNVIRTTKGSLFLQYMPVWWRWCYWACPFAWTLYGLVASQFGDLKDKLESGQTVEEFITSFFGFRHDFLRVVSIVTVGSGGARILV